MAVAADCRGIGIGAALVRRAIAAARKLGHGAVILVGDAPYYSRFGFTAEKTATLRLPGPFERRRLLALELIPGALDGAGGLVSATGRLADAAERKSRTRAPPDQNGMNVVVDAAKGFFRRAFRLCAAADMNRNCGEAAE